MRILRYALYFAPPKDDALTVAATRWLGRDAFSNAVFPIDDAGEFSAGEIEGMIDDPRRYGFHATLKAPFELAASVRENELLDAMEDFAKATRPFDIPKLVLGQLGPFFALVPQKEEPQLQAFAAATVKAFEPFRAALSPADIARRKPEGLSETQREHLLRWGYPYVMDEFRFYMSLTGPVAADRQPAVLALLEDRFAAFADRPLPISGLALFVEESRGAPFTVHTWLPLGAA